MKVGSPLNSSDTAAEYDLSTFESSHTDVPDTRAESKDVDVEKIGVFAGISGAVEVGLGSMLHAYHVPFKGHSLAYLQNIMLIAFGKSLHGKGLIRISFISAMMKAFSPMGARFAPMMYIFSQGIAFAAPVSVLGWNVLVVIMSSIMMSWFTLGLSLAMKYLLFGESIFVAFDNVVHFLSAHTSCAIPSLLQVITGAFLLKASIAILLSTAAYYGNIQPVINLLNRKRAGGEHPINQRKLFNGRVPLDKETKTKTIFRHALGDMMNVRFAAMMLLSSLLMFFFAGLSSTALFAIVVRGICISYLGFLFIRRVDILKLAGFLDRRFGLGLAQSLPIALGAIAKQESATGPKE